MNCGQRHGSSTENRFNHLSSIAYRHHVPAKSAAMVVLHSATAQVQTETTLGHHARQRLGIALTIVNFW